MLLLFYTTTSKLSCRAFNVAYFKPYNNNIYTEDICNTYPVMLKVISICTDKSFFLLLFPFKKHVDPDQVALLVKGEWRLSYVTPLHRFRYTLLKSYSKQMSAFIVSEKQQGLAVEVGPESDFKVTFSVVLGLAETDEDAETIIIQVKVPLH